MYSMKSMFCIVFIIIQSVAAFRIPSLIFPTTSTPKLSNCSAKYGNQPAKLTTTITGVHTQVSACSGIPGTTVMLTFTDNNGHKRQACLVVTSSSKRLPLLVWLHASLLPVSSIFATNLIEQAYVANLTGTQNGPLGYHLLMPVGRDTTHRYPPPDDQGLGWDNWYRNYNRSDPTINVDVQTIDYFIDQVVNKRSDILVDSSRIFMSGWSNGGAMAMQYALNTPGIAAAAVYSAPDPYRDYKDPCAQTPNPKYFTPLLTLYNQCDILGICQTGKAFIDDLKTRYGNLQVARAVIVDSLLRYTTTCNSLCTGILGLGAVQHLRWPVALNDGTFFDFLRKYKSF